MVAIPTWRLGGFSQISISQTEIVVFFSHSPVRTSFNTPTLEDPFIIPQQNIFIESEDSNRTDIADFFSVRVI